MPLCPQVTITPITVTTTGMTTASVIAANAPATTEQLIAVDADAAAAAAAAAVAAAEAATALSTANAAQTTANAAAAEAATSLQVSSNTIVNASNQLTAINGNGVTVYAGASASSGARVVLNSSGITGFNASGTATFAVDANNGNVSVTGTVNATSGYFGTPSNGWSISATGLTGVGTANITGGSIVGTQFTSPTFSVSSAGFVTATSGLIGGWSLSSNAISKTVSTRTTTLNATDGLLSIYDSNSGFLAGGAISIGTPSVTNYLSSSGMTIGSVVTFDVMNELGGYSGIPRIYTGSGNYIRLVPNAGLIQNAYPVYVEGPLETLGRIQCYGAINLPNIASTSSTANVRWTTGGTGTLQYNSASSIRFKDNVTDITNVPGLEPKALLDLQVRAFTYKPDYLSAEDDRSDVMIPGFIAEELDAIYPMAVDYDENGVHTWNDRMVIPGLLWLIQDLYKEIKILKGGIDE